MSTKATKTTPHYNLSQWEPEDHILRSDFNADNAITDSFTGNGITRKFSRQAEGWIHVKNGVICRGEEEVLPVSDILLPGVHNIENYMAAICAVQGLVSDEIIRDYATTQSLEQIVDNITRYICADDGSLEPISEGKYNCKFQSQSYYNPFAGATNRHLSFVLEVSTDGNMAHIVLSNLIVTDNYVGYGVNSKTVNVTYRIQEYNDILNKYNQSTNKKEKKSF